jgi:ArsR family transcriptional regulator
MKTRSEVKKISRLLRTLGQPARLRILLTIGEGEACVCHLEALLGLRQAYISQHLMALRQARLLKTRREGRYVFYRLGSPQMLDLIRLAGQMTGVQEVDLPLPSSPEITAGCACPSCAPEVQPA